MFLRADISHCHPVDSTRRYQQFRTSTREQSLAREAPPGLGDSGPESELDLQARWFAGEFGRQFTSTDGRKIEIIQFGHWNHSAGPDFTEAAILIDGRKQPGDIEIDLDAYSWESHGHATNPSFENVVLHVFLAVSSSRPRFFSRTAENREVVQLALDWEDLDDWGPRAWNHLPEAHPGRCCPPLRDMPADKVESLITAAARYRLQRRARRLSLAAQIHGVEEALYQAIAEALGFYLNRLPMRVLSQRLSLDSLSQLSPIEREARLFGAAGFIDFEETISSTDPLTRTYLKKLWDGWWHQHDQVQADRGRQLRWQFHGIRPLNHPQRRLGALATLTNGWPVLRRILPIGGQEAVNFAKPILQYFTSLRHSFWNHHYTLQSHSPGPAMALIGRDRGQDILGNVLFPWLWRDHPESWNQYTRLSSSQENEKIRRACLRLFGPDYKEQTRHAPWSNRYYGQQGLLQIYADFCLQDSSDCQDCPFPEQLWQW